ncbi:hypothetical protein R6Q57_025382 [Mikania cordata]
MDECFIELMLEQIRVNKFDYGFDVQIWTLITTSFNENCNLHYDIQALQDRFAYFMKEFNEIKCLVSQKGFSWDDDSQMVVANDEVWEACSKEHLFATSYKNKVMRHYKDFCIIFGNVCSEKLTNSDVLIHGNLEILPKETGTINKKKRVKKMPLGLERSEKLQKNQSEDIKEAFTDMVNVVSKLVNGKTDRNYSAIEKEIDALQAIPDIDDDLLLDGCDILEDEKKSKTFLALDASLRKKWLLRKVGR